MLETMEKFNELLKEKEDKLNTTKKTIQLEKKNLLNLRETYNIALIEDSEEIANDLYKQLLEKEKSIKLLEDKLEVLTSKEYCERLNSEIVEQYAEIEKEFVEKVKNLSTQRQELKANIKKLHDDYQQKLKDNGRKILENEFEIDSLAKETVKALEVISPNDEYVQHCKNHGVQRILRKYGLSSVI